jgi:ABC-type transporter Mla subunit MlaD
VDEFGEQLKEPVQELKQPISDMAHEATDAARRIVDQARQQFHQKVNAQKDRLADGIGDIGEVLAHTGQDLDSHGLTGAYLRSVADRLQDWSDLLRSRELADLASQLQAYASERPALFLGGMLLGGFMMARFLKGTTLPREG